MEEEELIRYINFSIYGIQLFEMYLRVFSPRALYFIFLYFFLRASVFSDFSTSALLQLVCGKTERKIFLQRVLCARQMMEILIDLRSVHECFTKFRKHHVYLLRLDFACWITT